MYTNPRSNRIFFCIIMPLVSILIVDFLKAPSVVAGVHSILRQKCSFEYEIFIHDNSQNTENFEYLQTHLQNIPNVFITRGEKNNGYTKAYNIISRLSKGQYLAIVNPDIVWTDEKAFEKIILFIKSHPEVGIVGPRQKNPNGEIAITVRRFPNFLVQICRRTLLRNFPILHKKVCEDECQNFNYAKTQPVDWIQSSCVFLTKDLWENLGGFDETFFLFMADTALCRESWGKKKSVVFFAETEVQADGKRCSDGGIFEFFTKKTIRHHVWDALQYFWKYKNQTLPNRNT